MYVWGSSLFDRLPKNRMSELRQSQLNKKKNQWTNGLLRGAMCYSIHGYNTCPCLLSDSGWEQTDGIRNTCFACNRTHTYVNTRTRDICLRWLVLKKDDRLQVVSVKWTTLNELLTVLEENNRLLLCGKSAYLKWKKLLFFLTTRKVWTGL